MIQVISGRVANTRVCLSLLYYWQTRRDGRRVIRLSEHLFGNGFTYTQKKQMTVFYILKSAPSFFGDWWQRQGQINRSRDKTWGENLYINLLKSLWDFPLQNYNQRERNGFQNQRDTCDAQCRSVTTAVYINQESSSSDHNEQVGTVVMLPNTWDAQFESRPRYRLRFFVAFLSPSSQIPESASKVPRSLPSWSLPIQYSSAILQLDAI
jgi:hypothetical protein